LKLSSTILGETEQYAARIHLHTVGSGTHFTYC
jgi:hypothetical protein